MWRYSDSHCPIGGLNRILKSNLSPVDLQPRFRASCEGCRSLSPQSTVPIKQSLVPPRLPLRISRTFWSSGLLYSFLCSPPSNYPPPSPGSSTPASNCLLFSSSLSWPLRNLPSPSVIAEFVEELNFHSTVSCSIPVNRFCPVNMNCNPEHRHTN